MTLFLLLACSDKDTTDSEGGEETAVEDSSVDDTSTDDTGAPSVECTLGAPDPLTVPVDKSTPVLLTMACSDGAALESVTLDGEEVAFTTGEGTVTLDLTVKKPGRYYLSFQVAGKNPASNVWQGDVRVHGHGEVTWAAPHEPILFPTEFGPLGLVWAGGDGVLALSDSQLISFDNEGTVVAKADHNGVCQFGKCFCVAGNAGRSCSTGSTVSWETFDYGVGEKSLEVDSIEDHTLHGRAPRAIGLFQKYEGPVVRGFDLASGKTYDYGALDGEFRVLGDTFLQLHCPDGKLLLDERQFADGKLARDSVSLGTDCDLGEWSVSLADVDGDGSDDEIHVFDDGDGSVIIVNGDTVYPSDGRLAGVKLIRESRPNSGGARIVYQQGPSVFSAALSIEGGTTSLGDPLYHGPSSAAANPLHSLAAPSEPPMVLSHQGRLATVVSDGERVLAQDDTSQFTREVDKGEVRFLLDGTEVPGLTDAGAYGLLGGSSVSVGTTGIVVGEEESAFGADLDAKDVVAVGPGMNGTFWLLFRFDEGVGRILYDEHNLVGTQERLKKRPDLLTGEWDQLADEHLEMLEGKPSGLAVAHGDGSGSALGSPLANYEGLLADALVAPVPGDGVCGVEVRAFLSETADDEGVVVNESKLEDCSDLAFPLLSFDPQGDGGSAVLLSSGDIVLLSDSQLTLVPGSSLIVRATGNDLDGDQLGDLVVELEDGSTEVWLSNGDGTFRDGGEVPEWVGFADTAGFGVGHAPPPVILSSWGAVLE